jgi:type IV pilus assembly protein PilN
LTAAVSAAIFWLIGQYFDQQIGNQNARNTYLQTEITRLDAIIKDIQKVKDSKAEIEKRMALIEQLQSSRNIAPIMLDELVRVLPQGVSFNSMKRTEDAIEIEGVSDSNNRLSEFVRKLENSKVFVEPELRSIVADTSDRDAVSTFRLKVKLFAGVESMAQEEQTQ